MNTNNIYPETSYNWCKTMTHTQLGTLLLPWQQIYYFLKNKQLKTCILSKRIHTTYWHQETAGLWVDSCLQVHWKFPDCLTLKFNSICKNISTSSSIQYSEVLLLDLRQVKSHKRESVSAVRYMYIKRS